jgi:hypothetical protein
MKKTNAKRKSEKEKGMGGAEELVHMMRKRRKSVLNRVF